jgi:hypothetical protein
MPRLAQSNLTLFRNAIGIAERHHAPDSSLVVLLRAYVKELEGEARQREAALTHVRSKLIGACLAAGVNHPSELAAKIKALKGEV